MHTTLSLQTRSVCGTTASRTEPKPQLSDEQWDLIADMFPDMSRLGPVADHRALLASAWRGSCGSSAPGPAGKIYQSVFLRRLPVGDA